MTPTQELSQAPAPHRTECYPPQRISSEHYAKLLARGYAPPPDYLRRALSADPCMSGTAIVYDVERQRIVSASRGANIRPRVMPVAGLEYWLCERGLWKRRDLPG